MRVFEKSHVVKFSRNTTLPLTSRKWLTKIGQLQKMGILPPPAQPTKTPVVAKRKSTQLDFGSIAPLSTSAPGTKNFAGYRDTAASKGKGGKLGNDDSMDSDNEEDDEGDKRIDEDDGKDQPIKELSLEEAMQEEKLSEDVRKIRVCLYTPPTRRDFQILSIRNQDENSR
jgi:hypothetical protein